VKHSRSTQNPRGRLASVLLIASACGGPPQTKSQVAVVYKATFTAEPGVSASVVYPWPTDGIEAAVLQGIQVSDGGTVRLVDLPVGKGLSVEGHGSVQATFENTTLEALSSGSAVPEAALTLLVADGGPGDRYFKVNKGGSASLNVEFEYTVSRDCGQKCGGKRSWTYAGPVGLSVQPVTTTFIEEKTP
jgi:hypothetical protein